MASLDAQLSRGRDKCSTSTYVGAAAILGQRQLAPAYNRDVLSLHPSFPCDTVWMRGKCSTAGLYRLGIDWIVALRMNPQFSGFSLG
jgi:hypothetical protein